MIDHRATAFTRAAPALAKLDDDTLTAIVATATPLGAGIGGETAGLDVDGVPVFVKRVPLTATELAAPHDTGNLFGLPGFYQYGIGSAGFGAWRELTAHRLTTAWVRSGRHPGFPMLYHWRVLPRVPAETVDVEERVAFWDGSAAVRRRLTELNAAGSALVLFLERIPYELGPWLTERLADGDGRFCAAVAAQLEAGLAAMNAGGLLHFDAHMGNLLTDGRRVYLTDFGLALHSTFARAPDEVSFLRAHAGYDRNFTAGHLATWLAFTLGSPGDWERAQALVAEAATGALPAELDDAPAEARRLVLRDAPTAVRMNDFFAGLIQTSKHTAYPYTDQINNSAVR
ncbi:serine/threonine protein phosphatase [Dactylosporangium sp. NPDC051484]|uniref:serine/threonine protein phosphatase n=1 Tax=Dactylosporangium sp. NPDC051484 TaxID=3154942 RepID=UPI00344C38EA